MKKRIAAALIFGVFLNIGAGAAMVSFFVLESGLPTDGPKNQHSQIWESAFMDVFFDAGHIVSNAPIERLDTRPNGEILRAIAFDIDAARDWGIDYLVLAWLDYNGETNAPCAIAFYIYRVRTRQKIFERRFTGQIYGSSSEEVESLKSIARGLVPYITD